MSKLIALKEARNKRDLARLLGCKLSKLTYILYIKPLSESYHLFEIRKKSGGFRTIHSPSEDLKFLQSQLSRLLLDCVDEINSHKFPNAEEFRDSYVRSSNKTLKIKIPNTNIKQPSLSHGFVRRRSVITNALMHVGKKNILNIDIENYFDSFNFGRVRGFFIKNKNFVLKPEVATVIAQIACFNNKLPQGSPCSPVISNLITHTLDIRLAELAKKYSCTYTRYADDITFSTRESTFPKKIMGQDESGEYVASKTLLKIVSKAGFTINESKTRILFKDSRQDVTGLVVNKKPNTKKEYWRTVKSQCHSLFQTGEFYEKVDGLFIPGNINSLEGKLGFIDQVDHYNRLRQKPPLNPVFKHESYGKNTFPLLSGREKTFSRFLFYRWFYGNEKPTVLCEGKTDNIYLKLAIRNLSDSYSRLIRSDDKLKVNFFNYSSKTKFLMGLHGGTDYLSGFISKFTERQGFYGAPEPLHPVIVLLDNDSGFNPVVGSLSKAGVKTSKSDLKKKDFIHVGGNLYVVLTPLDEKGEDTAIEDLFHSSLLRTELSGKTFSKNNNFDVKKHYGKEVFANKVVRSDKYDIDFSGFSPLLDRLVLVLNDYRSRRKASVKKSETAMV